MAFLRQWILLRKRPNVSEHRTVSCEFGSPHKKPFRFLAANLDGSCIERKCSGNHRHLKIEGKYTKPSAVYVQGLADAIALAFHRGLASKTRRAEADALNAVGLESPFVSDLAQGLEWKVDKAWDWQSSHQINILEAAAQCRLARHKALLGAPCRYSAFIDSNVARCALAKGRSSSHALTGVLRRTAAIQIAAGLYSSYPFCPTRHMPADGPRRHANISPPVKGLRTGLGYFSGLF